MTTPDILTTTPELHLDEKQTAAEVAIRDWLTMRGRQVFRLFGFAGTGKTTVAKHLAGVHGGQTVFAAYTGKAASVMRKKGCHGATTIHRLIYKPVDDDTMKVAQLRAQILSDEASGQPTTRLRKELDDLLQPKFGMGNQHIDADTLVVVDECSMVDAQIGSDLESFGAPILVLGDPAQLPPIKGTGYFTDAAPDVLLDEVHRQTANSGILTLATDVRTRQLQSVRPGTYGAGDGQVDVVDRFALWRDFRACDYDQVLVGTHKTRRLWTKKIREQLGRANEFMPEPGDRLVAMKTDFNRRVVNGEMWTVLAARADNDDQLSMDLVCDDDPSRRVAGTCVRHWFENREEDLKLRPVHGYQFAFGYALTVHKAQGSEWPRVLLINEARVFSREKDTPWRWLYTGITRAASKLVVGV